MNIKDVLGFAGVISGLITFCVGVSSLPQSVGQVPPNESPQQFSDEQRQMILNSGEFKITMCGVGVSITSYVYLWVLRYYRDTVVIDLPLALAVTTSVPVPLAVTTSVAVPVTTSVPVPLAVPVVELKPIMKTVRISPVAEVKPFRYPPPYEILNKKFEISVKN